MVERSLARVRAEESLIIKGGIGDCKCKQKCTISEVLAECGGYSCPRLAKEWGHCLEDKGIRLWVENLEKFFSRLGE